MPYVHRMVQAGRTVEHRKMQSFRVHTKGVQRGPNKGTTTEKQARINERVAEEHLRWDLNANFDHRDLHAVLHYYDKDTTFEEILAHKAAFLANLRKACRKARDQVQGRGGDRNHAHDQPAHTRGHQPDGPGDHRRRLGGTSQGAAGVSVSSPWTAGGTTQNWRPT